MSVPPENAPDAPISPYAAASATPVAPPAADTPPRVTGNLHAAPPAPPRPLDKPTTAATAAPASGYAVPREAVTLVSTGPIPASVGRRSGAFILDLFLTFVAALVATIVTLSIGFSNSFMGSGLFGILGIPAIAIAANTVMVWLFGCTLGQRMTGLRVVDATTGRQIGPGRTLARLAIIISPILLLILLSVAGSPIYGPWGAGFGLVWVIWVAWFAMFLFAALSGRGSAHDIVTKTTVVRGPVAA
jgi:uncharacterized RDD family membrane protein YckC